MKWKRLQLEATKIAVCASVEKSQKLCSRKSSAAVSTKLHGVALCRLRAVFVHARLDKEWEPREHRKPLATLPSLQQSTETSVALVWMAERILHSGSPSSSRSLSVCTATDSRRCSAPTIG